MDLLGTLLSSPIAFFSGGGDFGDDVSIVEDLRRIQLLRPLRGDPMMLDVLRCSFFAASAFAAPVR